MNLLIFGPQGSGKGTQAGMISKKFSIPHISVGDLFRNAEGRIKEELNEYMNRGLLVPISLVTGILKNRLDKDDAKKGFILDGFPRNEEQDKLLKDMTNIDKVIEITLNDDEAIKRISSRLSCMSCNFIFNRITNHPKEEDICDNCGSELFQREDDKPETIKKRLELYHKETEPILKNYSDKLIRVNGEQSIEKIFEEIINGISG